jgi:hypothetical protein
MPRHSLPYCGRRLIDLGAMRRMEKEKRPELQVHLGNAGVGAGITIQME